MVQNSLYRFLLLLLVFSGFSSCYSFSTCLWEKPNNGSGTESFENFNPQKKVEDDAFTWFESNISDPALLSETMQKFKKFHDDVNIVQDIYKEEEMNMASGAKCRLDAGLEERAEKKAENYFIEACLMDLIGKARIENNRYLFFQLKYVFLSWILDQDTLHNSSDYQLFIDNLGGRQFGFDRSIYMWYEVGQHVANANQAEKAQKNPS